MVLPNLIIAGVNKAGTTSLFETLVARPDVAGSREKETHHFSRVRFGEPPPPLSRYAAQFADARDEPVVVESTPSYLYGGHRTAATIDGALPDVRILVVLRDPVERAFSWFRFARSRLMIPADMTFETYLDVCESLGERAETEEGRVGYRGLSGGAYDRYVADWRDVFGERLRVTWFEQLRADPVAYLADLERWLGLEHREHVDLRRTNRTTDVRNTTVQQAALRVNRTGEQLWRRFPQVKRLLRAAYYTINARPDQDRLEPADRQRLDRYFAPHTARLHGQLTSDELSRAPVWVRDA